MTMANNGAPNGVVNSKKAKHKSKGRASYEKAEQNHNGKYKLGRGVTVCFPRELVYGSR
jgi:hypothetical protein